MESNKLSLNVTKTQSILIGGRKKLKDIENSETQNLQIVINQEPVSKINHTKYLGIVVDPYFTNTANNSNTQRKSLCYCIEI